MRNHSAAVLIALALVACEGSERSLNFQLQDSLLPADKRLATEGVVTLIETCPGIARYWGDLSSKPVTVSGASATDERERGWKRVVAIEVVVAASPKMIPAAYRAGSHHCYFDVGITEPRGVSIAKNPCLAVCRDQLSSDSPAFVPAVSR